MFLAATAFFLSIGAANAGTIQPWMCLGALSTIVSPLTPLSNSMMDDVSCGDRTYSSSERCGGTSASIAYSVSQFVANASVLNAASFEVRAHGCFLADLQ